MRENNASLSERDWYLLLFDCLEYYQNLYPTDGISESSDCESEIANIGRKEREIDQVKKETKIEDSNLNEIER
jgi:hypothetical protein